MACRPAVSTAICLTTATAPPPPRELESLDFIGNNNNVPVLPAITVVMVWRELHIADCRLNRNSNFNPRIRVRTGENR
jgi:hypothetical protein